MCYVDIYDLVYPDGRRIPQQRVIPCVRGTREQPCTQIRTRRQPQVHTMPFGPELPAVTVPPAQYVEIQPGSLTAKTSGQTLRGRRRGRDSNDLRLEFNWHIPFTSRDDDGERGNTARVRSAGSGPLPPPPLGYVVAPAQSLRPLPSYPEDWQNWQPRIINVDPAFQTPPATPQSSHRRSRSAGPSPISAGREHIRGQSRQRSESSTRHGSRHASPRPSHSRADGDSSERMRDLTAQIERLRRQREEARAARARDDRIAELTEQIKDLQMQRSNRTRIVETHHADGRRTQREVTTRTDREPPRGGAGSGRNEYLRNTGRRAIQRDMDDDDEANRRFPPRVRGGARGRIAGPEQEENAFARTFKTEPRRSDSRRRDRKTERMVYAGEGTRPHRWF